MKPLLIITFLLNMFASNAQKTVDKTFRFDDINVEYTRLDYSKYGTTQFIIMMFDTNLEQNLIKEKSINCLRKKQRLYHTLYFFLKIPSVIKSVEQKNELFSKFMEHLVLEEKLEGVKLYFNFNIDYSVSYRAAGKYFSRVNFGITSNDICKYL